MSLYADFRYAEKFYGSDILGDPPGGPANLNAYQNNIDTVVLYWSLDPCSTAFHDFVWTVDVDTVDTFDSADKITYVTSDSKITLSGALVTGNTISVDVDGFTVSSVFVTDSNTTLAALAVAIAARPNVASATVVNAGSGTDDDRIVLIRADEIETPVVLTSMAVTGGASQTTGTIGLAVDYIVGQVHKGIAVPIYPRLQGQTRPMYWRVKGRHGWADTVYVSSVFTIPQAIDEVSRDAMLALMPDPIYKKTSDSNNYGMHWTYGQSLDEQYVGDVFANNDIAVASVRDITLQSKFGDYVRIMRPQNMKAIDFREILKFFFAEARESPTTSSVINVVNAALCVEPTILEIRDTVDLEVADDTLGQEVNAFYVTDDNFYQTITFSAALITGNSHSVDVDAVTVTTPFNTDNDTTLQDIATNLATQPGIAFAAVVDEPGLGTSRVIVFRAANPLVPPVLENSLVTGGVSQASTVLAAAGSILPATVWDNVHLSGGIILEVTNPLGAIVNRQFLQEILRKLVLANFPLYVTGIA